MQGASHSTEDKWNNGVQNLLNHDDVSLCCLQECGSMPNSAAPNTANYSGFLGLNLYTWGTDRAQKYILFYPSDPTGNRCNLAIVSKIAPTAGFLCFPLLRQIWRPTIGLTVDGTTFFTLHAISPHGPDAIALVTAAFGALGVGPNVIVAGDYNRDPTTMSGRIIGGVVCPPDGPTHPANNPVSKFDYIITNTGAAKTGSRLELNLSDHLPVCFY